MKQVKESYFESFKRFEKENGGKGPNWLRPIQETAFHCFSEMGFPTTRDEDWKFTNVSPIAQTPFQLPQDGNVQLSPREIDPFAFTGLKSSQLVFVNGRYIPELSILLSLPKGVKLMSLPEALLRERDTIEPHLARYADFHKDAFLALNTAFMEGGAFVYLPRGTVLEDPIHILYISTATDTQTITHPRNLIVTGENTEGSIIESHVSLRDEFYFSNGVTEVVVGEGSVISHYHIERESRKAYHISTLRVEQGRNSHFISHSVLIGGNPISEKQWNAVSWMGRSQFGPFPPFSFSNRLKLSK